MSKIYRGIDLDGISKQVEVQGEIITEVKEIEDKNLPLIAPPLVDLQHNGAMGRAFNHLHKDPEVMSEVANLLRRHGVGRVQATFTTYPFENHLESLKEYARIVEGDANLAKLYTGIFFEGNYMSRGEGWRGAHNPKFMRDPSWQDWSELQEASGGRIRMFNIDPELPGALETIAKAASEGIKSSIGHCGPSSESIRKAIDAGASMVTHFANGAPPMVHRHRNPFWSFLAAKELTLGLILDGHHLPDDVILAAFSAKGKEGVCIVSDASEMSGMPPGEYSAMSYDIVIEEDGFLHLKGQEMLAGAWHQLDRSVEKLCEMGWSLRDAWFQLSIMNAKIMDISLPKIAVGEKAEFVISRWDGKEMKIEQSVFMGKDLLSQPVSSKEI